MYNTIYRVYFFTTEEDPTCITVPSVLLSTNSTQTPYLNTSVRQSRTPFRLLPIKSVYVIALISVCLLYVFSSPTLVYRSQCRPLHSVRYVKDYS